MCSEDGVALRDLKIEQSEVAGTSWYKWRRHNPWHSWYIHLSVGVMHGCSARRIEVTDAGDARTR
jgi:hypothetical protein